jgi:hypothetical protein
MSDCAKGPETRPFRFIPGQQVVFLRNAGNFDLSSGVILWRVRKGTRKIDKGMIRKSIKNKIEAGIIPEEYENVHIPDYVFRIPNGTKENSYVMIAVSWYSGIVRVVRRSGKDMVSSHSFFAEDVKKARECRYELQPVGYQFGASRIGNW